MFACLSGAGAAQAQTIGERDFIDDYMEVPRATTDLAFSLFPEGSAAGEIFVRPDYDPNFVVEGEGYVTVTFIREVAVYRDTLGYFTYTYDNNNRLQILDRQLVFPNASFALPELGYGGGLLSTGDTVTLRDKDGNFRYFTAGTRIGFFLIADGWRDGVVLGWDPRNPTIPSVDPRINADFTSSYGAVGGVYTTLDAINPEASRERSDVSRHMGVVRIPGSGDPADFLGGDDYYILAAEDLARDVYNSDFDRFSDNDFNDQIYIVHAPQRVVHVPGAPTQCQKQENNIVLDRRAPTLQCGTSSTVTTSSLGGACSVSQTITASAADECDRRVSLVCNPADVELTGPGTTTATCIASDGSDNAISCDMSLTLVDDTAPAIVFDTPSGNLAGTSFCNSAPVSMTFTASDNCGCNSFIVSTDRGTVTFDRTTNVGAVNLATAGLTGTIPVTVSVTDCANNTTQKTLTVNVIDCTPPPQTCSTPLTQGYWKNHASAWDVTSLVLGDETYSQQQLLALFGTPVRNDASLNLAHQLIAAKLNVANGADASYIAGIIAQADAVLARYAGRLGYNITSSSSTGQQIVRLAAILDDYNNGRIPSSCQSPPPPPPSPCNDDDDDDGKGGHGHDGKGGHEDHGGKGGHDHDGKDDDCDGKGGHDHDGKGGHDHDGKGGHDHDGKGDHDHDGKGDHDSKGDDCGKGGQGKDKRDEKSNGNPKSDKRR